MKKEIKLGFFLLAVFLVMAYFIIKTETCSEIFSKGKRYPLVAKFTTAAGMYTAAAVRLAGIKIGIVDKIVLEHRKAVVVMMIDKKYNLLDDARVAISTIGFVGEKYVEIVYKDEYKTDNPRIIPPGGEIKVIEPFNLDEIKTKFDNIYERTIRITDSINEIISDKYSKESLRASFINLKSITGTLNAMLSETGKVNRFLENMDQISVKMSRTVDMVDHFIKEMDSSLNDDQKGMLGDLKAATGRIDRIAADLTRISEDLRQGKGTAGKLLQDEQLYHKIDDSVSSVQEFLKGLEKSRNIFKTIVFNYAVHFDYFTRLQKARSALAMNISSPGFLLMTGVNQDPLSGDPRFTALGGKSMKFVSVAAGLVESDLGALLSFNMWNKKLNLDLYAYGFTRAKYPILKTLITFSLSKNINLTAGYYDLLKSDSREFMMGISLGN
jgi:phospholipid/cholesterol/gamma-HCH transport system substrate-binding protein